jgi:hypothetical protein
MDNDTEERETEEKSDDGRAASIFSSPPPGTDPVQTLTASPQCAQ